MTASLLLFVPVALLAVVSAFCFVGCAFDSHGLGTVPPLPKPFTKYSGDDVLKDLSIVAAYWPLNESSATATKPVALALAVDVAGTMKGDPHNGNYTHVGNAPVLFPCPGFPLAPGVDTAAASGSLTLGSQSIVQGDAVQPGNDPNVLTTGMQTDGAFVTVPLNAVVNPAPPFTVECWVRPEWKDNSGAAFRMVIDSRDTTGGTFTGFCIDVNEQGNWEAELGTVGASGFTTVTAGKAALSAVTYVVLTVDVTNVATLFINGNSMAQTTLSTAFSANKVQPLIIGAGLRWLPLRTMGGPNASFPLVPFTGTIQDVAIYNTVLSQTTISTHFIDGIGTPVVTDSNSG
jgi:hypothetical protein